MTLLLLTGCLSSLTGNEGNFTLSYWTDDDVVDFNKPIAVGASLDLIVRDVEADQPVTLTEASSDDPSLTVSGFSNDTVTVTGAADGGALISVAGTTSTGESLTDSLNLLSSTPEVLKLGHSCDVADAAYLSAQDVYLPFELEMQNGQSVIGYGLYPVTVAGTATLDLALSSQTWMVFNAGAAGVTTLTSTLDSTVFDLTVVVPNAMDGIVEPFAFVAEDIDVGDTNAFYVWPSVGDLPICQADTEKTVLSDTPEICDVRDADAADGALKEYGWFEIEGVAAGTCLYTVTFPAGNGGAGVSQQFSYTIEP